MLRSLGRAFLIVSCCGVGMATAGVTIEPAAWQSNFSGMIVPSGRQVLVPGQWTVEAPGTAAALPQYWKVVEVPVQRAAVSVSQQPASGGGGRSGRSLHAQQTSVRPVQATLAGVDVWVRIPSLFLTLPSFKMALPDPLGQPGRPPTTGSVGANANVSTVQAPTPPNAEVTRSAYGRSMVQLYPYLSRTPQQWEQERHKVLAAPPDQRVQATQTLLREAGLAQQVRRNLQPRVYSVPQINSGPDVVTNLHELDPKLLQDDSVAGLASRQAAEIASLSGLEKARWLQKSGDVVAARTELEATTALNPEDAVSLNALAVLQVRGLQVEAAAKAFGQAIRISPAFSKLDFSDWGVSPSVASESASRLMALAKRCSGRAAVDALLLAAAIRAGQGNLPVARRLAEQAKVREPGVETESLIMAVSAQWIDNSKNGNSGAKPASQDHE